MAVPKTTQTRCVWAAQRTTQVTPSLHLFLIECVSKRPDYWKQLCAGKKNDVGMGLLV